MWAFLCRLLGHRPEIVFDTGSWAYLTCSRCHENTLKPSAVAPQMRTHEPDASWLGEGATSESVLPRHEKTPEAVDVH